jgi:hypothetical protein
MKFASIIGLAAAQTVDFDAEVPEYLQKNRPKFDWSDPTFYADQLALQFNRATVPLVGSPKVPCTEQDFDIIDVK